MGIVAAQRYMVSGHLNFFSLILINVWMRLKFRSTTHLKLSKYLYQEMLFSGKFGPMWLLWGNFQYRKYQIFFHGSSSICKWGLSSRAHAIWTFGTCLNWYHIGQISKKSFFGLGRGQIASDQKTFFTKKSWILVMHLLPSGCLEILKFMIYHNPLLTSTLGARASRKRFVLLELH